MVNKPCRRAFGQAPRWERVAGWAVMVAILVFVMAAGVSAQQPEVHYLHHGIMPPGAIGSQQLQRGGPLPGFFQPVEIRAPYGTSISLAVAGSFEDPQQTPVQVGMLIAPVYRIRVTNIPRHPGEEVYPTIEVVDRLYTPQGQQRRFAVPIDLTQEDMELALEGKFVTRVIYLEDPKMALPVKDPKEQNWFEAGPGRDPLAMADRLGRPVAILRMGGRVPADIRMPGMDFLGGCPPMVKYPPRLKVLRPPPRKGPAPTSLPKRPQP